MLHVSNTEYGWPLIYAVRATQDGRAWIAYAPPSDVLPTPPWEQQLPRLDRRPRGDVVPFMRHRRTSTLRR